ncbi:MAG: DUF3108 domain-containing protein [Endomicrobiales bacterium]|nr:DUF3108 domain-containing protein [Endomicrobiales bacterium]
MINKRVMTLFVLAALVAFSLAAVSEEEPVQGTVTAPEMENDPFFIWRQESVNGAFKDGEKLDFAVRWKFITVGYATMEIDGIDEINGRRAFHIYTEARSAPFFDVFYKVRDTNESWMDFESLCSLKFLSRINEKNAVKSETLIFDQPNEEFLIVESSKTGKILPWVQDILSSLYYLRTKDLEVGKKYSIDAHSGDLSWPLTVRVTDKEKIKVPAGEFECFLLEPAVREGAGLFQSKGKLWVWVTADSNKFPVMMRSKIPIGSVVAVLTDVKL